ncbi:GntR family transcriptional regulator [Rhodobacteraceae bacterium NNCM2]|nr:GntR family transcriptional regulator [Coraliihabitans acroporae]
MQIDPRAISRRPIHDELVEHLRDLIVRGTLAPGTKVQEQALCDQFDVSRTPLREALRSLAAEGLVVLTPRRGASIAEVTRRDLEEAFPIVGALEALAGELACQNITDAEIERAGVLQRRLVDAHDREDLAQYSAANAEIHQLILAAANNPTLAQMLKGLDGRVRRARYMVNISGVRWAAAVAEHELILEALQARDGKRLGEILKEHIANKLASLSRQLDQAAISDGSPLKIVE